MSDTESSLRAQWLMARLEDSDNERKALKNNLITLEQINLRLSDRINILLVELERLNALVLAREAEIKARAIQWKDSKNIIIEDIIEYLREGESQNPRESDK